LVDPDRLRDVVVGARVEGGHLLALVADRGEHDHGCRAPGAQLAHDVGAGPVREHEVDDQRVRRSHRRRRERRLGGLGGLHLVAGAAQGALPLAQDLPLVVDDQDPRAAHSSPAAGSSTTNVAPWPGRDSAQTRASFASAKPRAIASPSPAPRTPSSPRWNGSKIRSRSAAARPGPWSTTRTSTRVAVSASCTRTGSGSGEYLS